MLKVRFFGAAEQVTGSCTMVTCGPESILVDCGLFQGGKDTYNLNYEQFGFKPSEIEHLILTHAHADHSGRIPLLHKRGFEGTVHAHFATCDLAEIILIDSAHVQSVEASWRTRKNVRRGDPKVEPLYTKMEAESAVRLFKRHRYDSMVKLSDRFSFKFIDAGHIIGSAILLLEATLDDGSIRKIIFSGDLGRMDQPIIKNPDPIDEADYLVIESTYGGRNHKDIGSTKEELAEIIAEAAKQKGNVIIPSFAVGRSQEITYFFRELWEEGKIPHPYETINLDSPMAGRATAVYDKALHECYDDEALKLIKENGSAVTFPNLNITASVDESMLLNMKRGGQIIVSASGMCDAGRILHHLRHNLDDPKSHIVIVGYQAEGTKGRKLVDGQPVIKIMGDPIEVKAKIHTLNALSAHADQKEILEWAGNLKRPPKLTIVNHGEIDQAAALKKALGDKLQFKATTVAFGEEVFLEE